MKALLAKIRAILKDRKARRFWARVISILASVVVFISTYALILPAITMETVAACGIEAHQHSDDCYEEVLVCGMEKSDDHQHTDSCYERVLICGKEAHIHSTECYKEDSTAVAATGGMSVPVIQEDAQSGSPETSGRDAGSAEAVDEGNEDAAGAGRLSDSDSDSQEPDGSADTSGTWDTSALTVNENAADATTKVLPEDLAEEELAGGYVPALEALNFDALLTKETGFYYFHPEEGKSVPENSSDITDWKELKKDTTLASTDLVKAYLAYSIPAGALNETNQIARYRLPANIHLTDDQILAINSTENGIASSYVIPGTETTDDPDNYRKYLGAEAVEGSRTPDKTLREGAMEYVSAVVKAENVYENTLDENGNYVDAAGNIAEDQGEYLGQDLIFIFTPYTIQKNQNTYDNNGDPIRAGEKVTGWFAVDFNMDQIDWIEQDTDLDNSTIEKSAEIIFAQEDAAAGIKERAETLRLEEPGAALAEAEVVDEDAETESSETENAAEGVTEENAADGAADEAEAEAADESATADTADPEKEEGIEKSLEDKEKEDEADSKKEDEDGTEDKTVFKDGTLTADGDGCHITLDYTAEAQIPEKASLSVKEITPDTDPEAYAACLQQAAKEMGANLADDSGNDRDNAADTADADHSSNADSAGKAGAPTLDTAASRFFDIEIVVTDEEGNPEKIEPKAPVAVNIQLSGTPKAENGAEKDKNDAAQGGSADSAQKADPTVLHFAEEGVEKIESTIDAPASETGAAVQAEDTTAISFEAESFSIYGVVYTVDFHWEVDGKTYEFSIPGGGFVSLERIAEVLRLSEGAGYTGNDSENGENETEAAVENTGEESNTSNGNTFSAADLNALEISEEARQFVENVERVEFSSPELVWINKVESDSTVGELKDSNNLECEYSLELTEKLIEEINAQTVEAGDWALISMQPFTSVETLTVTMKNGEVFTISVTDAQLKKTVISDSGETWEITVTYGEDALIPTGSELEVRELTEEDGDFSSLCENAQNKLQEEGTELKKPVLFDISIVYNGEKIEPAENSNVKVDVKLVRSALRGIYTDEETPLLINDEPLSQKNGDIDQNVQVIHQLKDGEIELVETEDIVGEENVTSSFTTDSFSDWLLFLDETVENITIGVNDTLTLRPYSKWVWKSSEEVEEYANYEWNPPQNSNVISFRRERKYDDQLREEYYFYHGQATRTGTFDLQLKEGDTVKHTIHVTVVNDVPDLPAPITKTEDIKINLFDYDINQSDPTKSGVLDARGNTASGPYDNTVNRNHDLKFLGWGGGNVDGWSINNYSQDVPNPGIVQNRLTDGYPKLTTGSNQSLDYLFNTSSNNSSVKAYPNVNGLFQKDTEGYYYYNSNSNYAYYNASNNTFTLYDHTYSQWTSGTGGHNAKPIGFFPFHKYDSYLKEGNIGMNFNTNLNHHFGMDMTVDFEIPSDGLDDNGNPIIFEFSGDDDMWVFVDDNLVLDVGGIHQPVTGKINFSSDKVEVFGSPDTTITQRFLDANSPKAWEIGDGKPHTMKIFYLERGGCDSNLSIKFNTPIRYGKGKLSLVKREKNKTTPLKDAKFGIWDKAKCQGDPIAQYTTDDAGTINFGEFVLKSATTTFYLKEIEQPGGYIRDPDVYQIKPRLNNGEAVKDSNGYIILDVFDKNGKTLQKLQNDSVVFPNTKIETISIPAKKKWVGGSGGNATVTLTINRFKLIDKVKGFVIVKELWDEPDDYTFNAVYRITYPDGTQKNVNYNEFSNGSYGIEDAVPGDYLIEEVIRSTAPNGYHMEHTSPSLNVTLQEDGTALAFFKTTFIKDMGKLYIKENVTTQGGSVSDIDYSTVKYAVLDASGKKVASVTHAQAAAGISLDLPVGTYSVKAVSVPDEPHNYERTEQYVVSGNLRQNGTILHNISVTSNNQTRVDFNTTYLKLNNAQNCKWKIKDTYNNQEYASGNVAYPVGTKLMMTFLAPQSQAWNNNYSFSYNGQDLSASVAENQTDYEFEVEFTVVDNAELVFKINGRENQWHQKNVNINGPRFEVIEHAPHTHSGRMMLSAKRANAPVSRSAQNTAKHPDAPEGKKYVKDSTWSKTVVLNSGNNWIDNTTLKDMPATDDEGNKYYYYVASVDETGVPEGTVCNIDLDGEDILLIGQDSHQGESLSATNTLPGSLKITKEVTVNRVAVTDHSKACPADGTYTFTITKDGTPIDDSPVEITITNGVAVSTEVDSLPPGTYRVTENQPSNGAELDKINGSETTQNYYDIVVEAGKTGATAPNVTFTNNIVDTQIKVIKVKKDTEIPVSGAKFKLTRVDDEGHPITAQGESYSFEDEVDSTTGELEFTGLKKGRYKLEETLVPDGYIKKEQFYFFTIDKNGSGTLDTSIPHEMISPDSGNEFTVENEPGAALPSTGGPGTQLFTILGSILILGAGVLLWRRRRLI